MIGTAETRTLINIGILGTGIVGRSHAAKLASLGHEVMIGTRDPAKTLAVGQPDAMGNPPFSAWQKDKSRVKLVVFAEAAARGEFVINALHGGAAVEALKKVEAGLEGKVLIDISNPLDFSKGMPPSLFVCNTDSLGEQIQRALPRTKVVKTLNTMNALLQMNPRELADGDHHAFVSGNDASAKGQVIQVLKEWYGWRNIIDLGDITTARGVEMLLPMWVRLWGVLQTPLFNYKIVK
jgi:predicted dinucleotide-binding enzyme